MLDLRRLRNDLIALGLLAVALFVALSLVSYDPADPPAELVYPPRAEVVNWAGSPGAQLAHTLHTTFGLGAWAVFAALLAIDIRLFARDDQAAGADRLIGWALALTSLCVGLTMLAPGLGEGLAIGSGGYLGAFVNAALEQHFTGVGILILLACVFASGLILTNEITLVRWAVAGAVMPPVLLKRFVFGSGGTATARPRPKKAVRTAVPDVAEEPADEEDDESVAAAPEPLAAESDDSDTFDDEMDAEGEAEDEVSPAHRAIKVNRPATMTSDREAVMARLDASSSKPDNQVFELPSTELLEHAEDFPYELLAKKARIAADTLEKTFKEFGLNVKVVEIDTGPVITQFELELEAGLRLNKVTALADDLAIALRVPSVRVVAPIPGKNTVGVEVPNEKQVMVRLRELIESCPQELEKKRIPIFVGKDVSGRPLVVDMCKLPHLLIAGRTGTGKSVCLNTLILSILMTRSPDEVKMLMIDPKMVELSPYKRVPHLMHPVITDMKKAEAVLAWAVDKMEERYDLLARVGVRHLDSYNKLGREAVLDKLGLDPEDPEQMLECERIPEKMPYIVIIADEMADMIMTSGKEVEGHIIRLAQKSRAVGIHLVLATQKPTVDVITGLIKSNLPARIAFQVASRTDSRVVLDEMGADRLLGNGDMLYLAPGTSHLNRAQGTFVSDEEINAVIDFYSDHEPQYSTELARLNTAAAGGKAGLEAMKARDELYEQAIEVIIREGRGSVSLLQRALGIGYGRGARLIDYMAEDGIVGDYNGSQAREVLYTPEQWEALKAGAADEADEDAEEE